MARTYRSQFLSILRELERRMSRLFNDLAAVAAAELLRRQNADGTVSLSALYDIQAAVGLRVTQLFLGQYQGGRQPFVILPSGQPFPLSPYARQLLSSVTAVERLAARVQQNTITRFLADNPGALAQARRNMTVFTNPFAKYEAAHTWVDPSGYQLSERIWRTAGQTRRKLDLFLEERIRQGQGARDMARDLETFLQPGRTLRTRAPYGTDASYDAMRLARTEITRAHSAAFEAAAMENPYVIGLEVVLSGSHPKPDICDEAAAAGPYLFEDGGVPDRYKIPLHPQCLCSYRNVLTESPAVVTRQLSGVTA